MTDPKKSSKKKSYPKRKPTTPGVVSEASPRPAVQETQEAPVPHSPNERVWAKVASARAAPPPKPEAKYERPTLINPPQQAVTHKKQYHRTKKQANQAQYLDSNKLPASECTTPMQYPKGDDNRRHGGVTPKRPPRDGHQGPPRRTPVTPTIQTAEDCPPHSEGPVVDDQPPKKSWLTVITETKKLSPVVEGSSDLLKNIDEQNSFVQPNPVEAESLDQANTKEKKDAEARNRVWHEQIKLAAETGNIPEFTPSPSPLPQASEPFKPPSHIGNTTSTRNIHKIDRQNDKYQYNNNNYYHHHKYDNSRRYHSPGHVLWSNRFALVEPPTIDSYGPAAHPGLYKPFNKPPDYASYVKPELVGCLTRSWVANSYKWDLGYYDSMPSMRLYDTTQDRILLNEMKRGNAECKV